MFFPACTSPELMAPFSVPLPVLIPGDPQGNLRVPCYPGGECPETARFRLSDYAAGQPSGYFVPLYSSSAFIMERFSRSISALTHV